MNRIKATQEMVEDLPAGPLQHVLLILVETIDKLQEQIDGLEQDLAEQRRG